MVIQQMLELLLEDIDNLGLVVKVECLGLKGLGSRVKTELSIQN